MQRFWRVGVSVAPGLMKILMKLGDDMRFYGVDHVLLTLSITLFISGCSLMGLREDLQVIAQASQIKGSVTAAKSTGKPVCVLLLKAGQGSADKKSVVAHQVIYPPEEFAFNRFPGEYYLLAFEDKNEDLTMQSDEMAGWYGEPTAIMVDGNGRALTDLRIELRDAGEARAKMPQWYASSAPQVGIENISGYLHVGEVVPLDHPRFSSKAGELGMWEPVKFLEQYGGGVFFLEPYNREKIPVLFVHGMGGCPQDFRYLIEQLDRNRFQPWLMQYPSGMRLSLPSTALVKVLREMRLRYGFTRMHIVAHSMGGLVARDAINQLARQKDLSVGAFITLSTPWKGHPGTTVGVERSPVVIPCWYDMAPNSPFLKTLSQTHLPDGTAYYQLFGHNGGSAMFAGESADGTLPLSSMSDLEMQDVATKVIVFNESHMSILTSPDVAMRFNRILASPETTPAQQR